MKERRKYPRVTAVSDSAGSTYVRTYTPLLGPGVIQERWSATVTAAGPLTVTVSADSMVLMDVLIQETYEYEEIQWVRQHDTVPGKFQATALGPVTLGNRLLVDIVLRR